MYVQDDEIDQEQIRIIKADATWGGVRTYVPPKAHKTMKTDETRTKQKSARTNQISKYMTRSVSSTLQNNSTSTLRTYVEGNEMEPKPKRKNEREISRNENKIQKILCTEHVHQANIAPKHRKNRAKSKPTDHT